MIVKMNSLIIKIQLSENEIINEKILEDDEIKNYFMNIDNESIKNFDNKENFKLTKILEEIFFIILSNSLTNKKSAFHINLSIDENNNQEQFFCQICSQRVKNDENDQFHDFDEKKISSIYHEVFAAARQFKNLKIQIHKRNLSSESKTI